jgi:phosphoglycolate phosphatase-like HAD superfamily hydrolase
MAHIVLDFDGTLADTKQLLMEIANQMAVKYGWRRVDEPTFRRLRKGTIRQALAWFGIPLHKVPMLFVEGRRRLKQRVPEIHIFPELAQVVAALHAQGHSLYVVSANDPAIIAQVLESEQLASYFSDILHAPLMQKARVVKRLVRKQRIPLEQLWLVGDEQRDINAAKRVGAHSIAVTWGLQDAAVLESLNPDAMAQKPGDILKIIDHSSSSNG